MKNGVKKGGKKGFTVTSEERATKHSTYQRGKVPRARMNKRPNTKASDLFLTGRAWLN